MARCAALAEELMRAGHSVLFVTRDTDGLAAGLIPSQAEIALLAYNPEAHESWNEHAHWLDVGWETDARWTVECLRGRSPDWIVVDHYALDGRWEEKVREGAKHTFVIDDLADRNHVCEVILDQNLVAAGTRRYCSRVSAETMCLLGPKYALLRPEFREARIWAQTRVSVDRIMVFLGGGVVESMVVQGVEALREGGFSQLWIDVVVGAGFGSMEQLESLVAMLPNARIHVQTTCMAELMHSADLAVGAAGSATWERASLGLPTVAVAVARNQEPIGEAADDAGILEYLGPSERVTTRAISRAVRSLADDPARLSAMSERGHALVDAGGTIRVREFMERYGGEA